MPALSLNLAPLPPAKARRLRRALKEVRDLVDVSEAALADGHLSFAEGLTIGRELVEAGAAVISVATPKRLTPARVFEAVRKLVTGG
jgi:hypothetical protein